MLGVAPLQEGKERMISGAKFLSKPKCEALGTGVNSSPSGTKGKDKRIIFRCRCAYKCMDKTRPSPKDDFIFCKLKTKSASGKM